MLSNGTLMLVHTKRKLPWSQRTEGIVLFLPNVAAYCQFPVQIRVKYEAHRGKPEAHTVFSVLD